MSAEVILSQLDRVKPTGPRRWLARCPAHEDRSPSLSVRELDDGRILLHCFGGCNCEQIIAAAGVNWDALYPERPVENDFVLSERRPFPASDVLQAIDAEAAIVAVAAANIAQGIELTQDDRERLLLAAERIGAGRRLACGER